MKSAFQTIVMKWDGEKLTPAAPVDRRMLWALPAGQLVEVKAYKPRSDRQNRAIYRLLDYGEQNQTEGADRRWTKESIKAGVKIEYGWLTGITVPLTEEGKVGFELKSLTDLDKDETSRFIDDLINFICEQVIKGMRPEDLQLQIDRDAREEADWTKRRARHD